MNIFQIAQEDIDRSSTLDQEDLGKWVYIMNGCIMGFAESRDELEDMLTRHKTHS